ncbi:hypothetical protein CBR_g3167 [Chara braunii]|uniref:peptidyl-tRNA hydrolase n=1 Tax=Chara braunii TaxID=69332 RepID=A0A388KF47_CHABU|nr:hypothetical protein CBR_g3167 [Chara braunii]|eukprot:GBG68626.1 hypothetical protein CBR_g3167 [Chara braunii]
MACTVPTSAYRFFVPAVPLFPALGCASALGAASSSSRLFNSSGPPTDPRWGTGRRSVPRVHAFTDRLLIASIGSVGGGKGKGKGVLHFAKDFNVSPVAGMADGQLSSDHRAGDHIDGCAMPAVMVDGDRKMAAVAEGPTAAEAAVVAAPADKALGEAAQEGGDPLSEAASAPLLVQYLVLRKDLVENMGWSIGSVVAQACHAAVAATWLSKDDALTQRYCSDSNIDHMRKVVLEVKGEKQLVDLSGKLAVAGVGHKLWVEQPENFPTCLATKPCIKEEVAMHFKKCKLCK